MGDIVLAADDAQFGDHAHFAVRDSVAGDGSNIIWCELLGRTRAMYFLLTGELIPAREGKRIGFVNEVPARRSGLCARAGRSPGT